MSCNNCGHDCHCGWEGDERMHPQGCLKGSSSDKGQGLLAPALLLFVLPCSRSFGLCIEKASLSFSCRRLMSWEVGGDER